MRGDGGLEEGADVIDPATGFLPVLVFGWRADEEETAAAVGGCEGGGGACGVAEAIHEWGGEAEWVVAHEAGGAAEACGELFLDGREASGDAVGGEIGFDALPLVWGEIEEGPCEEAGGGVGVAFEGRAGDDFCGEVGAGAEGFFSGVGGLGGEFRRGSFDEGDEFVALGEVIEEEAEPLGFPHVWREECGDIDVVADAGGTCGDESRGEQPWQQPQPAFHEEGGG